MIPEGVDVADLTQQLSKDGVAYSNQALALDNSVQAPVAAALHPGDGVAVVDIFPESNADLRDLATVLQDNTGLDTVIIQAPAAVSSVSTTYNRAELEAVQSALEPGIDQVTLLHHFYGGVDSFSVPWVAILGVLSIAMAAAGWAAFNAAVQHTHDPKGQSDTTPA